MTIRFHLDESVSLRVVRPLRDRDIDVTTPEEAGLLSATDEEHLAFAHDAGRVLVAHDNDYIRLHADDVPHSGIAYCHQRRYSVGDLLKQLLLLHACYDADEMVGKRVYL